MMQLSAHRGVSQLAPENTFSALKLAQAQGQPWAEVDIQLSSDAHVVLWHDAHLSRCSNGHGRLCDTPWAQLQALDCGAWFSPAHKGEPMLDLKGLLNWLEGNDLRVNIELKLYPHTQAAALVGALKAELANSKIATERLLFSSFSFNAMLLMASELPQYARGMLYGRAPARAARELAMVEAKSVHVQWQYLRAHQLKSFKAAGYAVHLYTVNSPSAARRLREWGADVLISDCPHTLQHV